MDKRYSDSLFPFGIGTSFTLTLIMLLLSGTFMGFAFQDHININQFGAIPLFIIFVVLLVGPMIFIRKQSRFEQDKKVIAAYNGIGTIQGLRGVSFRLRIYERGFELRAFYHRYYIPFQRIDSILIQKGLFINRMDIVSDIDGIPEYIISSQKDFLPLIYMIEEKVKSNQADLIYTEKQSD